MAVEEMVFDGTTEMVGRGDEAACGDNSSLKGSVVGVELLWAAGVGVEKRGNNNNMRSYTLINR